MYAERRNKFMHVSGIISPGHIFKAIDEMLRVSKEVRIFPILDVNIQRSPYVDEVVKKYGPEYPVEEVIVDYEFQKGGNTMLTIGRSS